MCRAEGVPHLLRRATRQACVTRAVPPDSPTSRALRYAGCHAAARVRGGAGAGSSAQCYAVRLG
eukprot:3388383-Pleurochrysis_carterae.AAC.2